MIKYLLSAAEFYRTPLRIGRQQTSGWKPGNLRKGSSSVFCRQAPLPAARTSTWMMKNCSWSGRLTNSILSQWWVINLPTRPITDFRPFGPEIFYCLQLLCSINQLNTLISNVNQTKEQKKWISVPNLELLLLAIPDWEGGGGWFGLTSLACCCDS